MPRLLDRTTGSKSIRNLSLIRSESRETLITTGTLNPEKTLKATTQDKKKRRDNTLPRKTSTHPLMISTGQDQSQMNSKTPSIVSTRKIRARETPSRK